VGTGFPKRSCSNKKIERDDDSKKSHRALTFQSFSRSRVKWIVWSPLLSIAGF
jgi:hypothetical protein